MKKKLKKGRKKDLFKLGFALIPNRDGTIHMVYPRPRKKRS